MCWNHEAPTVPAVRDGLCGPCWTEANDHYVGTHNVDGIEL